MAAGALIFAIGLCAVMFGTAYIAVYLPLLGSAPDFVLGVIGLGVLMVAGGLYGCITGAFEETRPIPGRRRR